MSDCTSLSAECTCHHPDGEMAGWHLLTDWEDAQPGDILYDGELWMACRRCNWNGGQPIHEPEGAITILGYGLNAIPWPHLSPSSHLEVSP